MSDRRDRRDRSVARTRDVPPSPAEEIRALLDELHGHVETAEKVPRFRPVRRGPGKEILTLDWAVHRVRQPGLLAQLGVIAAPGTALVETRRWIRDPDDQCAAARRDPPGLCPHGRWITVRTERRPVPGSVAAGAAMPSRSPAWDEDGALAILAAGGSAEAPEPVTDAWHAAEEIRQELAELGRELHAQGFRPPATLVTIALDDEEAGARVAARLRALVARARVAAAYDAPPVTLRDRYCPRCGGPLRVRTDASSAVWCAGRVPLAGPAPPDDPDAVPYGWAPCGARWPRYEWLNLLEQITAEDTEDGRITA